RVYVTSQRDGTVTVLDTTDPAAIKEAAVVPTGAHPVALRLNRAQTRLYVANAHSDTVSVVDTAANRVTGTILLRPLSLPHVAGATPTGLALSADEKTLYVTLGDLNAVAVVDVAKSAVTGYIPTGWYPTAVAATSVPDIGLKAGKIKHVIYIIKENRTYDQVLGDLTDAAGKPVAKGDPALTLFGAQVTPNQHALALRFVTLDNFYDCGEASG